MEVRSGKYQDYQTVLQWAKQGCLPKAGEQGIELWANNYHQSSLTYYAPNQVEPVSSEHLHEFFHSERVQRNQKAREHRKQKKEQILREQKQQEQRIMERIIQGVAHPYEVRITELCQIVAELTEQLRPEVDPGLCCIIDTETTGLDPIRDELLQCSILGTNGNVLYNSRFQPCASSWTEAEAVNHITPQMVQDAPAISMERAKISEILSRASVIIGYNTSFDLDFLRFNGIIVARNAEIFDLMERFAPIYGEWDDRHNNYRWKSLQVCADYYGYDWNGHPEQAHDSLADCRATLFCYKKMIEDHDEDYQSVGTEQKPRETA